jgi:hypothetical protein
MTKDLDELYTYLLEKFPNGAPEFTSLTLDELDLHSRKNADYAKNGHPLGNFMRRAELYSHYPGLDLSDPQVVALVDMMKQLDAALWMTCQGYDGEVEDIDTRLRDVHVYAKIARVLGIYKRESERERKTTMVGKAEAPEPGTEDGLIGRIPLIRGVAKRFAHVE